MAGRPRKPRHPPPASRADAGTRQRSKSAERTAGLGPICPGALARTRAVRPKLAQQPKRPKRSRAKPWHVYLVRCADGSLYCGVSNDLAKRVASHNAGTGAKYTRARGPVTLVWSRRCGTKSKACQHEYRIKQLSRTEKLRLAEQV